MWHLSALSCLPCSDPLVILLYRNDLHKVLLLLSEHGTSGHKNISHFWAHCINTCHPQKL